MYLYIYLRCLGASSAIRFLSASLSGIFPKWNKLADGGHVAGDVADIDIFQENHFNWPLDLSLHGAFGWHYSEEWRSQTWEISRSCSSPSAAAISENKHVLPVLHIISDVLYIHSAIRMFLLFLFIIIIIIILNTVESRFIFQFWALLPHVVIKLDQYDHIVLMSLKSSPFLVLFHWFCPLVLPTGSVYWYLFRGFSL